MIKANHMYVRKRGLINKRWQSYVCYCVAHIILLYVSQQVLWVIHEECWGTIFHLMKASAKLFCGSPEEVTPKYRNTVLFSLMLRTTYFDLWYLWYFSLGITNGKKNTLNFVWKYGQSLEGNVKHLTCH